MKFHASRMIAAPPSRVFDFVADPANEPLWMIDDDDDVSSMATEHIGGPATGVGARYCRTNVFGPRTATVTLEVMGFEPGSRIEYASEDEASTTFLVEPTGGATRLSCVRAYPGGWSRFTAGLVTRGMRRTLEEDLARIEQALLLRSA